MKILILKGQKLGSNIGNSGILLRYLICIVLVILWAWAAMALFFALPTVEWIRWLIAAAFVAVLPLCYKGRTFYTGTASNLICLAVVFLWWNTLQPTNEKEWAADVARIAHGKIQKDILQLHNVRDFRYTKEGAAIDTWQGDERWESKAYDLGKIKGLDLFLSYWGTEHIAHVIMSWDFGEDKHLAISIETRKDIHQEYSAVKGFFKQYELSYVAADEKDVVRLRTNFRKERVYLYRLQVSKEKARALLEAYIAEMNDLLLTPRFYDALTHNCTTAIFLHTKAINPENPPPMDWRIVVSGHLSELLYEEGLLDNTFSFPTLRKKSRVDLRMQQLGEKNFSSNLRAASIR